MTYNPGQFLPDRDHPFNVGECTDCEWDVHGPEIDTPNIHFACHMNRERKAA